MKMEFIAKKHCKTSFFVFKFMLLQSNPVKSHCKKKYKITWKGRTLSFHVVLLAAGITLCLPEAKATLWDGETADNEVTLRIALFQHLYLSNQCSYVTELKIASSLTRSNAISHRFLFFLETAGSLFLCNRMLVKSLI